MNRSCIAFVAWLAAPFAAAQQGSVPATPLAPAAPQGGTPAGVQAAPAPADSPEIAALREQFVALRDGFAKRQQAFFERYRAASDAEKQALAAEAPKPGDAAAGVLAIGVQAGRDALALECFNWVLRQNPSQELVGQLFDALDAGLLDHPKLGDLLGSLRYGPNSRRVEPFLRAVAAKSPHHDVQGWANLVLAWRLANHESQREQWLRAKEQPEQRDSFRDYFGADHVAFLEQCDVAADRAAAEALFEKVAQEFANVAHPRRGSLGKIADAQLFELRHLQVGKVAPDIVGNDVDGVAFKLSDYRGKVVVLDFWGFW